MSSSTQSLPLPPPVYTLEPTQSRPPSYTTQVENHELTEPQRAFITSQQATPANIKEDATPTPTPDVEARPSQPRRLRPWDQEAIRLEAQRHRRALLKHRLMLSLLLLIIALLAPVT